MSGTPFRCIIRPMRISKDIANVFGLQRHPLLRQHAEAWAVGCNRQKKLYNYFRAVRDMFYIGDLGTQFEHKE
eukprot:8497058-Prorocentrum_lima.AAC.1